MYFAIAAIMLLMNFFTFERVTTRTSRVHSRSPSPSGEPNERSRSAEQDEIEHHAYRVDHKTDDGSRKHAFHPYGR
jgi:hypothetical protein